MSTREFLDDGIELVSGKDPRFDPARTAVKWHVRVNGDWLYARGGWIREIKSREAALVAARAAITKSVS